MVGIDRTLDFKDLLLQKSKGKTPPARKPKQENEYAEGAFREKDYISEAHNIVRSLIMNLYSILILEL